MGNEQGELAALEFAHEARSPAVVAPSPCLPD